MPNQKNFWLKSSTHEVYNTWRLSKFSLLLEYINFSIKYFFQLQVLCFFQAVLAVETFLNVIPHLVAFKDACDSFPLVTKQWI